MTPLELANLLVDTHPGLREIVLSEHESISAVEIAESLQQMCYEVWTEDPQQVSAIAETLHFLADKIDNAEVRGYFEWAEAIREIVGGKLASSIEHIDRSEKTFSNVGKFHLAAKTQTSKLYSLAMLGRYDEAVDCGKKALEIFLEYDDLYSAGKIEHNIGNLYWRRDMYRESEPYLESARLRFVQIEDQRQIAMVENCQAFVKTLQNQFREAEVIYKQALERTAANNLLVTEAEIEIGLSNLYLFESKYDLALRFMEQARQKYERLMMPNQSAICELEIADIYLDLNLLPEAIEFYKKAEVRFAELGLQAELARCSLNQARAMLRLFKRAEAVVLLEQAEELWTLEGNAVAIGSARLVRSQLFFDEGDLEAANAQVNLAITAFEVGDNLRFYLFARWLKAEIIYAYGRRTEALTEFRETLGLAKDQSKEVEYLCLTSLGKIMANESYLESAIELVENSRTTLSSDELRTSYFAEKILPYNEIVKIKLAQRQFEEAFRWHERSRSRTLVDRLHQPAGNSFSNEKLAEIREELNWYYTRINRSSLSGSEERSRIETLRKLAFKREKEYAEMLRRLGVSDGRNISGVREVDISEFRSRLEDTTLVEFASIDGLISAFVMSKDDFTALPNYADEAEVNHEIKQFLFQLKTGRFIDRLSDANQTSAMKRLLLHSQRIYEILLRPLAELIKTGRIVFAPSGLLHYLPFHALHTGNEYLIELSEISYTPSVSVLDSCMKRTPAKSGKALIVGVADTLTPMVETEIESVAQFFPKSTRLTGPDATIENIRRSAIGMDVVHLACHGKFRPDNPGFSSLALFAEELTANEVMKLPLENGTMILSACETGLNEVVSGEELIGLTRAFFVAGACTLILSLWRVNDHVTLDLMTAFYSNFCSGKSSAEALRLAQRQLIERGLHPYFWSPFMVSGRW